MDEQIKEISALKTYAVVDEKQVDDVLKSQLARLDRKIIVLDDDPTGIQTVNGISVYTDWEKDSLRSAFREEQTMFFLLTNSRAFTEAETVEAHKEIVQNILAVSKETGKPFILVSRGDSTLRGHFPLETRVMKEELESHSGLKFDGEVIFPFFREGGRYTMDNIHYVKDGNHLVPAGKTEFAKDKTFGYASSHLGEWCEEKTGGAYKAEDLIYISLEDLRKRDNEKITKMLLSVEGFNKVIVNAIDYVDVKVFTISLIEAMLAGKEFIFRTAAAFPKVIGGVSDKDILVREDIISEDSSNGGMILVGSHVKKTTLQLEHLMNHTKGILFLEFNVSRVLEDGGLENEVDRIIRTAESSLLEGRTVTVYTSRELLEVGTADKDKILEASVKISNSLVSVIGRLQVKPSFIIAKGGITSSDVGTKALKVRKAEVMGQIKPGIPVWMTGEESKFPGMPYIIFPGNVGETSTLSEIANVLMRNAEVADDRK